MIIETYDVGGSWIRGAIVQDGEIKEIRKCVTKENWIEQIKSLSEILRRDYEPSQVSLALPGPVSGGILLSAPPLGLREAIDIKEQLSSLGTKIVVENDLNAAVLAELYQGYGKQWNNFYLLTLSTGIGAGIVINGQVVKGGEFGHNLVNPTGYPNQMCSCGKRNCWCAYSSGRGIEKLAETLGSKYTSAEKVCEAYRRGEESARGIITITHYANTQGLAMMVNALEMEGIVIMGSLGLEQFDILIPQRDEIQKHAINPVPSIVKTELGDNIGLLGAYYRALQ